MAIYKAGALVDEVRGTLGGNIFSRNKGGRYVRAWSRGSNPRSKFQSDHRANLVGFAQAWKALTTTEKGNWDTYAALPAQEQINSLGDPYYISGFNWYIRINLNLLSAGSPTSNAVPTLGIPPIPTIAATRFYKTGGSSTSRVFLTGGEPTTDDLHVFKVKMYNSSGRLVASEIKTWLQTEVHGVSPLVITFQVTLEEKFGTIIEGQRGFISLAVQYADGRRGAPSVGWDDVRA